jgi:methyl-accepting chemotaxis protein
MLNTIKAKLVFFSIISVALLAISITFSYLIAVSSIKTIMKTDVDSVADALEKNINYISSIRPDAYKEDDFKTMICSVKVGKSGYLFIMDAQGNLVVHPKDEGRNLAGQKHIDHIRNSKGGGGILEYLSVSTGQDKIVAYRYISKWNLWIVPGVNKADYFEQLKRSFINWNMIFGVILISLLIVFSTWITRTVTNPLKGMLRIFKEKEKGKGTTSPDDSDETRALICGLLENMLFSKR